jgi:hypothetical protein
VHPNSHLVKLQVRFALFWDFTQNIDQFFVNDVLGQPTGPIFKGPLLLAHVPGSEEKEYHVPKSPTTSPDWTELHVVTTQPRPYAK